jgi:hypothetical protein
MRKVLLAIIIVCLGVSFVYSQDATSDERVYVKTFPLFKILAHELGYKIFYTKKGTDVGTAFIPFAWFTRAIDIAQVTWGDDTSYPYCAVYYVNGKLDHITLYLQENMEHFSWGILNKTATEVKAEYNQDPASFKIEY